ncbi:MAG TPA: 16S rRNA (cytosine(1402)-N(4))-methyltransferase RsmH [Candidatus Pacearchaeota archaeon]|nr:16S rRNA (cytosine(1402)-N(4))-methyltransferase RsmH [Candidatus Pacearchaeota archaeon]HOK94170.1 16S rRNA (cytosine(1402)-N(4))-methyltransferase RsmH [Candidatus Pacearchaeota archaeon]HPO75190.1 16S rRNA (cytosine(1402)-N(4))-methyltransferase RsmH [Candidatus Pacearchaeota archaeon]
MVHIPVLVDEVIQYLNPKPNDNFIDATIDGGGHAIKILEKTEPKGKILGIDLDKKLLENLKFKIQNLKLDDRLILVNDSFKNLKEITEKYNFKNIAGILFDLGMSSWHLEESKRGFSFQRNETLDMRFNSSQELTAREVVNKWPEYKIEEVLREYGEERYSKRIAKTIVSERRKKPILTTFDLIEIIKKAVPKNYDRGRIHPATRTFQALRIATNQELENLKIALPQALEILENGGRIVVISFHSLEDRIVKNFFREKAKEGKLKILTKKPIRASEKEVQKNPRSRSAKLRAAIKLAS